MSARTAVNHKPSEMKYEGTRDGIAIFSSASKSTGGRNWTYVDVETRQVACECQAKPGTCWHADVAPLAFAMTRVAAYLATLDDATLATVGRAAGDRHGGPVAGQGRVLHAAAGGGTARPGRAGVRAGRSRRRGGGVGARRRNLGERRLSRVGMVLR
jgi:hypothetical protein